MPQQDPLLNLVILDHLPQGIFILRPNQTVAFWNQCLEEWTGIPKSAIEGTHVTTHFPHLGTPKYTLRFEPLFQGGPPATFASQFHPQFLPCTHPNGQPRVQQTTAKAIWHGTMQEWQALIIIQDISDLHRQVAESQRLRKQAQAEITERKQLEKAQAHLQRAVDQGVEGLALLDQAGRYTYINQAHATMYGYTADELIGQSWKTLYSKNQLQFIEERCLPTLRSSGQWQGELLGLRKDGTNIPVEISLSLLMNTDNSSDGLVCTCRDTTERKRAEERFRLVVETTPNGMIMVDTAGRIVLVNQLTESLFGYSRAELLGQQIEILVPLPFREEHPHHRATYLARQTKSRVMGKGRELSGLHKDGREIPMEVGLNPIETQEGLFVLASIVDITERKASEKQLQKNAETLKQKNKELVTARDQALAAVKTKSAFLSTMSHEIRTPLNGVIGMTDLIMDTTLDSHQREMIQTVKNSGEFLLNIINDILDFSKIEAGKLDLEAIDFDIRLVLDEVIDVLAGKASQKSLELIGVVYANIPKQLRGDPGRIRQILFNLIGNAIKFTEQGEIVVRIELVDERAEVPVLQLSVTDTGIGIPSEAQDGLFQSFTQADSSTTRKFGGTGLGLAICKQLVTLMHGEIGVTSQEGQGSTFWFTIPMAHSVAASLPGASCTSLATRRVCIVESNDTIRFLLNHYVQSWGMHTEVARNGKDGLALLQKRTQEGKPFDVALLDHSLSETIHEDGVSLAQRIRHDPAMAHTSLVLLSAFGKRGEGKMAQEAGFNGYLTKPIRHQQLHDCLTMVLAEPAAASNDCASPPLITRHTVDEAQARTQCHILLAEDNVVNQKVAVRMIQKLGYRVDVVDNGQAAVQALEHSRYHLVFMDCQMPEMDGLTATRKIREAESQTRQALGVRSERQESARSDTPDSSRLTPHRLPIVALTANALASDREACLQAGMDDFLAKPVRLEDLSAMIAKWVPHSTNTGSSTATTADTQPQGGGAAPGSPALDATILQHLQALGGPEDPDFFLTLVQQFLEDLPRHDAGIQQAIAQQDAEALTKAAHACKGACRAIGALPLAEVCYALEQLGRQGTTQDHQALLEKFQEEHHRVVEALNQQTAQTSPQS